MVLFAHNKELRNTRRVSTLGPWLLGTPSARRKGVIIAQLPRHFI